MAADVNNFDEEVLAKSHEIPVVADFWAEWCGPCRTLSPILERLDEQANGAWTLAKVNTEQHPDVAQRYHIRGIPAVKLFADGEVIDEFTGALPEHTIREWLDEALPSETKQLLAEAEAALDDGDASYAEPLLRQVLDAEPTNPKARILLARVLVFDEPDRAQELIDDADFGGPAYVQTAEAIETLVRLLRLREHTDELPKEQGRSAYLDGAEAVARQDFDAALERFIEVIQTNRYFDDDGARKACVAIFTLLGEAHPAVRKHRRTFDMALY